MSATDRRRAVGRRKAAKRRAARGPAKAPAPQVAEREICLSCCKPWRTFQRRDA